MPQEYTSNGLPVTLDQTTPATFQGRRIGNVGDVANNVFSDAKDMGVGAVALGNLGMARGYELLPLPGQIAQPVFRPGDNARIGLVGKAMFDAYKTDYYDPIKSGHYEDLLKRGLAHPLNTALDLSPLSKTPGLSKLSNFVGSTVSKLPAVVKAQEIAAQAAEKAGLTAQVASDLPVGPAAQMTPAIKGGVQAITEVAAKSESPMIQEAAKTVQGVLQKVNATQQATALKQAYQANVLAENVAMSNSLGKLWHKIPLGLRSQVRAFAEGHHPDLFKGKGIPETIKEYLAGAEDYSAQMRDRIKPFTKGQNLDLEKYQPATMKRLGLTKEQYTALSEVERAQILLDTKNALDKLGIKPQYSPHVNHDEVGRTLANPGQIKGSIKKHPLDADNQNFVKQKTSTGQYATDNHFDALRTRMIQIAQLHNAYETILKGAAEQGHKIDALIKAAEEAAASGVDTALVQLEKELLDQGLKPLQGSAVVESILGGLEGPLVTSEEMAHLAETLMPKRLFVPEAFADALKKLTATNAAKDWWTKWYGGINKIAKRYMLGGNMTYPEAQLGQAMPMLELVSMNGPISAMHSAMAYALLFSKQVREAVPLSIAENVMAAEVESTRYIDNLAQKVLNAPSVYKLHGLVKSTMAEPSNGKFADIGKTLARAPFQIYDDIIDFTLKRNAIYDNMLRAKAAIQYALDDNSQVTKAMWGTKDAVAKSLDDFYKDPAKLEAGSALVNKKLGDFQALSNSTTGKLLGQVTLFPSWFMYIWDYTTSLPKDNPFKTPILAKLSQVAEKYVADPNVPEYLRGAVGITAKGPNHQPQAIMKSGANALASVPEIATLVNAVINGDRSHSNVSFLNPALQLGYMYIGHEQPNTREPYKDPSLLTDRMGDQYRYSDLKAGVKMEKVESFPDFIPQISETLFPAITRGYERVLEKMRSGGERSTMTSIFKSAPKTYKAPGGQTLMRRAPDWLTMSVQEIINNKPIEYSPDARRRSQTAEIQRRAELMRNYAKTEKDLQKRLQ